MKLLKIDNLKRSTFFQYTILFCFLVIGIYAVLILNHKSFIQGGDGLKQGYFWTVEFKHYIESLLKGKGLTTWSWSKMLGMSVQTGRYWDPLNWIAAAFPVGYIELGYTVTVLLRMYCGGLAFLALMRYTGLGAFASVLGAILYAFSGYSIVLGLEQADFLINIYLFPLLVLSVEMMYDGKSPVLFSILTGLYLIMHVYSAYMAALSIVPFILFRYFAYKEFDLKNFAANTCKFAFYGVVGILIGCIQLIPDAIFLSKASTESSSDRLGLLFDKSFYLKIGEKLLGTGDIKDYSIMGWTLITIILIAVAFSGIRLKKTPMIMTLILFVGAMIPTVCSIYNAFGYPTHRWIFALELFAAWTVATEADKPDLFRDKRLTLPISVLGIVALLTIGANYVFDLGYGARELAFMIIQLVGGVAFITVIILSKREGHLNKIGKLAILVILMGTLSASWTTSFIDNESAFLRNNRINKKLEKSTQRAGALIDDDSFYRVDQVDSISYHLRYPANETLWWQTRSIYTYNSRVPADLLDFNRMLGNNYGYSKRVVVVSNDNRTGLDYLYGVKYFLGDDLKNQKSGSDEYAGYGFELYKSIDGVRVLKNKYNVGLGYVFDKFISEREFEKLGYAEREQALLQAVVLPDDKKPAELVELKEDNVKTAVKDVDYTVVESEGVAISNDTITVKEGGSSIILEPEAVENSQLLLSITGLLRNVDDGQSEPFEMRIKNEYVEELVSNKRGNQTIPNIRDYTVNLGYYENYSDGKIKILFWSPGKYKYDGIKIRAMDADLFDELIGTLSTRRYNIDSFSNTSIEGTVDSEKDGILFLSIIEPERWKCYIDGERRQIISNANLAFAGVEVPSGQHKIIFKLNNDLYIIGALISIAGIIIVAISEVIRKNRREI